MEKIDLNNYEAYFLDYVEGTLSTEEKHDLFLFLEKHPALKAEMEEDFEGVTLTPSPITFKEKEQLKISEDQLILSKSTVEDHIIASIEGQLTVAHQHQLDVYVKENGLEKTVAYYKATVLKPDTSITFKHKKQLKVKTGLIISMPRMAKIASVAAVGIILITVALNWNTTSTNTHSKFTGSIADRSGVFATVSHQAKSTNNTPLIIPTKNVIPLNQTKTDLAVVRKDEEKKKETHSAPNLVVKTENRGDIDTTKVIYPNQNDPLLPIKKKDDIIENLVNTNLEKEKDQNQVDIEPKTADVTLATIKSEEPYKIITDAASSFINSEVSFKRDKNVESEEYVAFSFKLGKFEFERKKGK